MKRLKEKLLEVNQLPSPSLMDKLTPSTPSSTPSTSFHTTRSNDTYVYGIGVLAVLAIGACVIFIYYNTSQTKNKKQDNERLVAQHEQEKQNQTLNDVICFRKFIK